MSTARLFSNLFRGLTSRMAVALAVLLICGLLAATLVRMAPGFGMDERMLDARLSIASLRAMERQGAEQSDILHYYWHYLRQLSRGDLGNSISSGRPVRELLSERLGLSLRSALTGLGLAWMLALGTVTILELSQRRIGEGVASLLAGALLCTPAALVALACVYIGAGPAAAMIRSRACQGSVQHQRSHQQSASFLDRAGDPAALFPSADFYVGQNSVSM